MNQQEQTLRDQVEKENARLRLENIRLEQKLKDEKDFYERLLKSKSAYIMGLEELIKTHHNKVERALQGNRELNHANEEAA